jgi:hypothetical protein
MIIVAPGVSVKNLRKRYIKKNPGINRFGQLQYPQIIKEFTCEKCGYKWEHFA